MANPICLGNTTCSISVLIMIVIFFITAIARRQLSSTAETDFSLIGGTAAGEIAYIILYVITSSLKWSFIGGLIGIVVGGFLGGQFFGDGGDD